MSKNQNETLYDKWMQQLKNNPVVVALLVIGTIAVGVTKGLETFNNLRNTIDPPKVQITEVHVSIKGYKLTQGFVGDQTSFTITKPSGLDALAEQIKTRIVDTAQPGNQSEYQATMRIASDSLSSDKSMIGYLFVINPDNPISQIAERIELGDLVNGVALPERFADHATFASDCNCIHLELNAPVQGYQDTTLDVYKFQNGYSFDPHSQIDKRAIHLAIGPVSILLESPQGQGGTEQAIKLTEVSLDNILRQSILGEKSLRLSTYKTENELRTATESTLKNFPIGLAKEAYLEQNRVDYIITVDFVMK